MVGRDAAITLEYKQAHLGVQVSSVADTWKDRIRWIVDEFDGGNQSKAARRLEVSPQAISALYSGNSAPRTETLVALLAAYPLVSAEWLLTGEGERVRTPPTAAQMALAEIAKVVERARDTSEPDEGAERLAPGEATANLPPPAEQGPQAEENKRRAGGDG